MEAEKRSLEKENQTLRSVLKQYLDGVSVNNETLKVRYRFVSEIQLFLGTKPAVCHESKLPTQPNSGRRASNPANTDGGRSGSYRQLHFALRENT